MIIVLKEIVVYEVFSDSTGMTFRPYSDDSKFFFSFYCYSEVTGTQILFFLSVQTFPPIPSTGGYFGLEPTKNCTKSQVVVAGERYTQKGSS